MGKLIYGVGFNDKSRPVFVNGKLKHLGCFGTPQEAFSVYKQFKESLCKQLALKWKGEVDQRLFNAMMNWQVSM